MTSLEMKSLVIFLSLIALPGSSGGFGSVCYSAGWESLSWADEASYSSVDAERVRAFVRRRYIHGVPEVEAKKFGTKDAKILERMLDLSSEKEYWPNIVQVLGYVGGVDARNALIAFLARDREVVEHAEFKALSLVPLALGHIADAGDQYSLNYLERLAESKESPVRDFDWSYRSYEGKRLVELFAEMGVNGLRVAGVEKSEVFLRRLKARELSKPEGSYLLDEINSALWEIEKRNKHEVGELNIGAPLNVPAASVPVCKGSLPSGAAIVERPVTVIKHASMSIDDGDVGGILGKASNLLKQDGQACSEEVACPVSLILSGSLGTFGKPKDKGEVITSFSELAAVLAMPGNFKVVDIIQVCADEEGPLGCTLGGSSVIEQSAAPDVWDHEFGHAQGLHDVEDCLGRIMNQGSINTEAVNRDECSCYIKP